MAIALGGHLLLAPASIAARAVATMLGLVLVRLAQQTAGTRALRTLALVVGHADKSLHNGWHRRQVPRPGGGGLLLLDGDVERCGNAEQMRLLNALCWFVELAGEAG
jgi:hypothetical protein